MEIFYIVIVIFLLILAVSDLAVGVSNDATNFLNAAVGSKVAPFRVIMGIACLGVIVGATFSGGMMDIARNGIFQPGQFVFKEIMIIFFSVMIADILLLNMFNGMGLPTSTTVSIVFDLLGASVGMAIYKITSSGLGINELMNYINTSKALAIISGILISVVIAFSAGALIQYFVRLLFTFNYRRPMRMFGGIFGGIAITIIVYFMLIKGAKGATFMKPEFVQWMTSHTLQLIIGNLIFWTVLLQALLWLFRVNILRIVILTGTFALAMAFAGNDLVNFIGVPLAGLESFKHYMATGANPGELTMEILSSPVTTPTLFLLISGILMAVTLIFSKTARKVIHTTVQLSRQNETGEERFESSLMARALVRASLKLGVTINKVLPKKLTDSLEKRFIQRKRSRDDIAFDQMRAAVNLVVASILIASGTALKLPLSTTYVTFMVAMGTSLADRAWDRESAVYRVTGVITVISGWFITALSAFLLAFIICLIVNWLNVYAILGFMALIGYIMVQTYLRNKNNTEENTYEKENDLLKSSRSVTAPLVFESCNEDIISVAISTSKLYYLSLNGLINENRRDLRDIHAETEELSLYTKDIKNNSYKVIVKLQDDSIESTHFYIQVVDYMRETSHCLRHISGPVFEHVNNNHAPLIPIQTTELRALNEEVSTFFNSLLHVLKNKRFDNLTDVQANKDKVIEMIEKMQKKQLKLIKKQEVSTRNSVLYLNVLNESKNLILFYVSLIKAERDFFFSIYERKIPIPRPIVEK